MGNRFSRFARVICVAARRRRIIVRAFPFRQAAFYKAGEHRLQIASALTTTLLFRNVWKLLRVYTVSLRDFEMRSSLRAESFWQAGMKFMASDSATNRSRDILASPLLAIAFFWLPAIAIGVAGNHFVSSGWRTAIWTTALVIMGAACLANSRRCGRTHCFITGPFFLVMAVVTALYGLNILPLGKNGWNFIGLTILVGAIVFCCLPEMLWGKYRKSGTVDRC
jgi:hypothetical protein